MKKFIVAAAFLVALSSAAWAQSKTPPQRKSYEERMKEKREAAEKNNQQGEDDEKSSDSKTKKAPVKRTPSRPQRKSNEEKMRERKEAEEQLKALEGENATEEEATEDNTSKSKNTGNSKGAARSNSVKSPAARSTPASRRKEAANPAPAPNAAVVNTYYMLPLDAIPQVRNYIEDKEDVDSKSIRRGFIRKQDATRGYLHLQLPADDKYTRIQEYKTTAGQQILAIETSNCSQGECSNTLKFYEQDGKEWTDVTEKYMPELDKDYILSKIKAKYKKDYLDLENYNNKGYETSEEIYNKAIISGIDPDKNRIVIKEQYLSLPLYELVWDGKTKFILKKL